MVNFAYVIGDRTTGEALIVDPAYAVSELLDLLESDGMHCVGVLGTHYHADHVGGAIASWSIEGIAELLGRVDVPIHLQRPEVLWVARTTGVGEGQLVGHDSGDVVEVGEIAIELLHTPGHTPGSSASWSAADWSPGTRCSSTVADVPTCPAAIPRRCTNRSPRAWPGCPTTSCCIPGISTRPSPGDDGGDPTQERGLHAEIGRAVARHVRRRMSGLGLPDGPLGSTAEW